MNSAYPFSKAVCIDLDGDIEAQLEQLIPTKGNGNGKQSKRQRVFEDQGTCCSEKSYQVGGLQCPDFNRPVREECLY